MVNIQEWVDNNYSTKKEKIIEGIKKSLEGELILTDFPNLNKISLANNKITKLVFVNCPNVKEINVYNNQIAELEISGLELLEHLHCGNNKLSRIDVSKNEWLKTFIYYGNPLENLIGSEKLVNLEWVRGKNFVKKINEVHESKLEKLWNLLNGLQISSNNKDHELEKKERKIRELKELLGKTKEEVIDYKLKAKEDKLEILIKRLGIDRGIIRELRKMYQQLIRARASDKQNEINSINDKIEDTEDELAESGIDTKDAYILLRKCESIAKLKAEQEKLYQEQFEAKQEIVLFNRK